MNGKKLICFIICIATLFWCTSCDGASESKKNNIEGYWMTENGDTISFTSDKKAIIDNISYDYSVFGEDMLSISLLRITVEYKYSIKSDELTLTDLKNNDSTTYYRSTSKQAEILSKNEAGQEKNHSELSNSSNDEDNLNYYRQWIKDDANIFSTYTETELAKYDLSLDRDYSSVVAVATVLSLDNQNIKDYASSLGESIGLGSMDLLLVISEESKTWYVVYGNGIKEYIEKNSDLSDIFTSHLGSNFFNEESDKEILGLFEDVSNWFHGVNLSD